MGIIFADKSTSKCMLCQKQMQESDSFFGKNMWHVNSPTCKHDDFIVCTQCWIDNINEVKCPICGCEELYC